MNKKIFFFFLFSLIDQVQLHFNKCSINQSFFYVFEEEKEEEDVIRICVLMEKKR